MYSAKSLVVNAQSHHALTPSRPTDNSPYSLVALLGKLVEDHSAGHTARLDAAVDTLWVDVSAEAAVDLHHLEAWSKVPDVRERNVRELASPAGCYTYSAQQGGDLVAEALPAVEARVAELPHTVDGVGTLRFGQDIFETALVKEARLYWTLFNFLVVHLNIH